VRQPLRTVIHLTARVAHPFEGVIVDELNFGREITVLDRLFLE
jgi:hypothetical protein